MTEFRAILSGSQDTRSHLGIRPNEIIRLVEDTNLEFGQIFWNKVNCLDSAYVVLYL